MNSARRKAKRARRVARQLDRVAKGDLFFSDMSERRIRELEEKIAARAGQRNDGPDRE